MKLDDQTALSERLEELLRLKEKKSIKEAATSAFRTGFAGIAKAAISGAKAAGNIMGSGLAKSSNLFDKPANDNKSSSTFNNLKVSSSTDNEKELDDLYSTISKMENKASKYLLLALYESKFPEAHNRNKEKFKKDELDTLVSYDEVVRDFPEAIRTVVETIRVDNKSNAKDKLLGALKINPNKYFNFNSQKRDAHVVALHPFNRIIANIYSCIHSLLWGTNQLNKDAIENLVNVNVLAGSNQNSSVIPESNQKFKEQLNEDKSVKIVAQENITSNIISKKR